MFNILKNDLELKIKKMKDKFPKITRPEREKEILSFQNYLNQHREFLDVTEYRYYLREIEQLRNIFDVESTQKINSNAIRNINSNTNEEDNNNAHLDADNDLEETFGLKKTDNLSAIDTYILTAVDSLENLRKQNRSVENIKNRLKNSLFSIRGGQNAIDSIGHRYANDRKMMILTVFALLLILFLLRFFW